MSNAFGNKLRILREEERLTQEDLGKFLNVHKVTISKWERGLTEPSIEDIIKLSKKLEVTTDELLDNKENKKNNITNEIINIYNKLTRPSKNLLIGFGKELLKAEEFNQTNFENNIQDINSISIKNDK